ncbi:hypothetical protein GF357_02435 [Candidatus Dojkabacteria bacterium]|nr:hypothetical protein [Candidatus Dojkabacteria bacterium]
MRVPRVVTAAGVALGLVTSSCQPQCPQPDRTAEYAQFNSWMERFGEDYESMTILGHFGGQLQVLVGENARVDGESLQMYLEWVQVAVKSATEGKFERLDPQMLASYLRGYNPELEPGSVVIFNTSGVPAVIDPENLDVASEATLPREGNGEVTEVMVYKGMGRDSLIRALAYGLVHQHHEPLPDGVCFEDESYPGLYATESIGAALDAVIEAYSRGYTYEEYKVWIKRFRGVGLDFVLPNGTILSVPLVDTKTFEDFNGVLSLDSPVVYISPQN